MKQNKGITLIALVVTIIVLLILAGVAIAMLTGDNSILKRAQSTKAYNALGAVRDEVSTAYNAAYAEYMRVLYDDGQRNKTSVTAAFGAEITKNKIVSEQTGAHGCTITTTLGTVADVNNPNGATSTVKAEIDVDGRKYEMTGTLTDNGTSSTFSWSAITESNS